MSGATDHPSAKPPPVDRLLLLWRRIAARNTERFKAYVRKAGMVDYWRAKGWPDLCHPTTADDFACE